MIDKEILINKFGQDLVNVNSLLEIFNTYDQNQKNAFLKKIIDLTLQSKVTNEDIDSAILLSNLKKTYTPCVLLKKGVHYNNLLKIISLPEYELNKVVVLLLTLFKVGYQRRYSIEKNNPNKWWYWDLSDDNIINRIQEDYKRLNQ